MIRQIKDRNDIPEVVKIADKIKDWDFDRDELILYLDGYISHPSLLVLLDEEREALTISAIFKDWLTPYVVVMLGYANPKYPDVIPEMSKMIHNWCRANNIGEIKIMVKKHIKGWCKKYNFKVEGIILKKEVQNG